MKVVVKSVILRYLHVLVHPFKFNEIDELACLLKYQLNSFKF